MKDTKLPQLVINDLTKKQFDEANKNNQIQNDELYITDEIYTEIPIGFGQWSESHPGDNWAEVTDDYVSKDDYPEIWDILIAILDEEYSNKRFKVVTAEKAAEMLDTEIEWKKTAAEQKLLYSYIVDRENNQFKFPLAIEEGKSIGDCDETVIAGPSLYNGCYSISSKGAYFELGTFVRLEKQSVVVDDITYNYHKVTRWDDSTIEIPTAEGSCGIIEHNTIPLIVGYSANEMINNKYIIKFYNTRISDEVGPDEETLYDIERLYPHEIVGECTNREFCASLVIFDERNDDYLNETLEKMIPEGETETVIVYTINGYVKPPKVADYNVRNRLYIKVA